MDRGSGSFLCPRTRSTAEFDRRILYESEFFSHFMSDAQPPASRHSKISRVWSSKPLRACIPALFCLMAITSSFIAAAPPKRFEKISDHFYYFQPKPGGSNVGAVVTEEGVVLIDPPSEEDLPATDRKSTR